jgi:hypothetical protein
MVILLAGCTTTDPEKPLADRRTHSSLPIAAQTFYTTTPQFGGYCPPDSSSENETKTTGSGIFNSPNLGLRDPKIPHAIRADDLKLIRNGMTREKVVAILGREPNHIECPGGSLGGEVCYWYEDHSTLVVAFEIDGTVDVSFFPTRQ